MQYLVAIHHPHDFESSAPENAALMPGISALNREMVAAGVRTFVGGLRPIQNSWSLKYESEAKVLLTDGPYLETKEHIGGFWVLDVASDEEALEWGRKAALACHASVEVRPFNPPLVPAN